MTGRDKGWRATLKNSVVGVLDFLIWLLSLMDKDKRIYLPLSSEIELSSLEYLLMAYHEAAERVVKFPRHGKALEAIERIEAEMKRRDGLERARSEAEWRERKAIYEELERRAELRERKGGNTTLKIPPTGAGYYRLGIGVTAGVDYRLSPADNNPHCTRMPTAKPSMVDQVLALHRRHYGDAFAVIVQDAHLVPRLFELLIERRQKQIATRLTIAPVSSTIAPTRSGPVMVRTAKGRKLMFTDGSGAFRIELGRGAVLHAIRCRLHDKIAREYLAGPEKTIRDLYLLLESGRKRARTKLPKRGLWRTFQWDRDVAYARWKIEAETARFQAHPSYAVLLEDARHFFEHVDFFTRHGQSGMRKLLLTGPPGTGKTSILMALANELGREMPVILCGGDDEVVVTCAKAAAQQRPCVVMVEEMDMLVRPSSAALGFLDGTDTPRNPAGTYLIATTNYPRRIDRRILKRPGRIDRVIAVGALRSRAAAAVAFSVLPEDVSLPPAALGKALDRTTPAEIREIVATAIRLCVPEPGQHTAFPLDVALIERARASLKHMIKTAEQLADDTPEEREDLHGRLGPLDDDIPF